MKIIDENKVDIFSEVYFGHIRGRVCLHWFINKITQKVTYEILVNCRSYDRKIV